MLLSFLLVGHGIIMSWYNLDNILKGCDILTLSTLFITIIVSLFSGLAGTFYLEINRKKSQKQKLSNCLILLYTEISNHAFWIKHLYSSNESFISCSKLLSEAPTTEWDNVKYFLAETLTSEDLKAIVHHYRHIEGLKKVLSDEPKFILPKPRLDLFVKDANHVLEILMKDHDVKEFVQSTIEKESKEQSL